MVFVFVFVSVSSGVNDFRFVSFFFLNAICNDFYDKVILEGIVERNDRVIFTQHGAEEIKVQWQTIFADDGEGKRKQKLFA